MSKAHVIIILGALVALVSKSGFPEIWKGWTYVVLGVVLIGIGILFEHDRRRMRKDSLSEDARPGSAQEGVSRHEHNDEPVLG